MIRQIEVSGSHYEMGYQQGKAVSDRIKNNFSEIRKYIGEVTSMIPFPVRVPVSLLFDIMCIIGRVKIKKALKPLPYHLWRMEGISDGSGIPLNHLFGTQVFEILTGRVSSYVQLSSCTAVILSSSATSDGEVIAGKNYDFPYVLRDFQIVRISRPKGRYSSISLTQDILVGNHNGMNEHGLCVLYTYCYPFYDSGNGIPITIVVEEILESCKTTEEAIYLLKNIKRGNGASLGIIDKDENFCVVEISQNFLKVRRSEDNYILHTNNYITDEMSKIDLPDNAVYKLKHPKLYGVIHNESSRKRYKRAEKLIKENIGKFNFENFEDFFRDHEEGLESENNICRKGPLIGTLSSIIFSPRRRMVKVCYGNPCKGEYKIYNF